MVFRKPYAFLIRNFKIIHIILGIFAAYLVYKTTSIVTFFRAFATTSTIQTYNLASNYINFFMYGVTILVIGLSIIIYLLMNSKDKKTTFYIATISYYSLLLIMFSVAFSILSTIETQLVSQEAARVYRDISLIIYLPQLYFVIYFFFRGFGFDIKKFNFGKDLDDEFEIDEKDREEVEIVLGDDSYKVKRWLRRFVREFKYYIKENTFIFMSITVLVLIIIGTSIFMNRSVYTQRVREGSTFTYRAFTLTALDSMVTNLDFNGNVLVEGSYFLLVNFNVRANVTSEMDMRDFRLMVGDEIIFPTFNRREHFIDFGTPYVGGTLLAGTERDYMLIFELDESLVRSNYRLRIVNNLDFRIGEIIPSYRDLRLNPVLVNTVTSEGRFTLNQEINLNNSNLGESRLAIHYYQITSRYSYNYEFCIADECTQLSGSVTVDSFASGRRTLLVLGYDITLADSNYKNNIRHNRQLFFHFATIRYRINGVDRFANVTNRTPDRFANTVVMQTSADIARAEAIDLIITIRNRQYIVTLK